MTRTISSQRANGISNKICIVRSLSTLLLATFICLEAYPQGEEELQYVRSSLCMMMLEHPTLGFNKEIKQVFNAMEIPQRFNKHDLGVRSVTIAAYEEDMSHQIANYVHQVQLGKRMVAKWFDRNKHTGTFDMETIKKRGLYNASASEINRSAKDIRGVAILEDAGENLIKNTYLVMNDFYYVDKTGVWHMVKDLGTAFVAALSKGMLSNTMANLSEDINEKLKSFRVRAITYLYRLNWDDNMANLFYDKYYVDSLNVDAKKVDAFKDDKTTFSMSYIGFVENTSSTTTMTNKMTAGDVITKVCTRALDKNIADLQHKFGEFRIKAPLISVTPIKAYVGMKEDITQDSRYEVLEQVINDKGITSYKRVGVIKPVAGKIWDNRFMAVEEGAENATLGFTTFEKISGGDFYPGMLIREIK